MIISRIEPSEGNQFAHSNANLIVSSYRRLTGRELLGIEVGSDIGHQLFNAPMAVLAHDTAIEPVFFYGNRKAQELFELSWPELVLTPSRQSALPMARAERQRLLDEVSAKGFINDYAGIRVSKSGKQFRIQGAVVWNLIDAQGRRWGQAAAFNRWDFL